MPESWGKLKKKILKRGPCSIGAYYLPGKMGINLKCQEQCMMTSSKCSMKGQLELGIPEGIMPITLKHIDNTG